MTTYYIGIDPGLDGALAIIGPSIPVLFDTPTWTVKRGKKSKREYNLCRMANRLARYDAEECRVYIEQVHSMPNQGVRSMFSMGYGVGVWEGLLAGLNMVFTRVTPQRWKGAIMDGMGKDKDASRFRAILLYPDVAGDLGRKKDHGRAEALLIAEYGRRQNG